ncbi:MAG: hypothetical protein ABFC34_12705 [Methanobacterium sp.]
MKFKYIFTILLFIIILTGISGCIDSNSNKTTFGEKKISLESIYLVYNESTGEYVESNNGTMYYSIKGKLYNNNPYDALNVKLKTVFYDSKGNKVAETDNAKISPPSISAHDYSRVYVTIPDQDMKIVRYEINATYAKAQY